MQIKQSEKQNKRLRDDPSRVVILGAGRGGMAMFETLLGEDLVDVVGIVDIDEQSPGMVLAKQENIQTYTDVETAILASAPCVVFNLTGNEMVEEVAANLLGVGGVIGGLEARLMWRMVTDLKKAKLDLEFQATHDVLTNLVNRRFMLTQMEQELDRCKRYGVSCSLVMLDLDYFKKVNDGYGHAAGDEVLKVVTEVLNTHIRGADTLARWGGEEFLVLLPHTGKKEAGMAAEKCLQMVVAQPIKLGSKLEISISFSAGVASFDELKQGATTAAMVDEMLAIVDRRLYQAKRLGRAQVVIDDKQHC